MDGGTDPEAADYPHAAVIQWGCGKNAEDGLFVLNPLAAVRRAADKPEMKRLLGRSGLRTEEGPDESRLAPLYRTYFIPVFHLQALSLFQYHAAVHRDATNRAAANHAGSDHADRSDAAPGGLHAAYHEIAFHPSHAFYRNLLRQAVRAVYALGLDFGAVTVSVRDAERPVILDVDAEPPLDPRLGRLYAGAIHAFAAELKRERRRAAPVRFGMDPEYVLCGPRGEVVPAARFLPRRGRVGCDAVRLRNRRVVYPLVELRPEPGCEPRELMVHLLQTMRTAAQQITDQTLIWNAGGMPRRGFPLGGHLHMSGIWPNARLLRALDNYLALPLVLIEAETASRRRPRYGFLGDFRLKSHGGFEYRTLPSWLVSPLVAKGVLALIRLIADHYWTLRREPLRLESIHAAYYAGEKAAIREAAALLWDDLERLPDYARYRGYAEPLKRQMLRRQVWDEQEDFRIRWRIPPYDGPLGHPPDRRRAVLSQP